MRINERPENKPPAQHWPHRTHSVMEVTGETREGQRGGKEQMGDRAPVLTGRSKMQNQCLKETSCFRNLNS